MARFLLALGLAVLCSFELPGNLRAQSLISGDIAGTVTDASGAAIPGASIKITNIDTGAILTLTTASAGEYRAGLVKPGSYTVVASAPNFQSAQVNAVVAVGQTATANLSLAVARGITTVEVQGTTVPLLQPENSDIATTISMEQVQNLPNPGGDITYYVNLTQGVVMNTQGGYGNSSAFGLPATSNNFTINGAQDNDPFLNLNNSGPSNLLLGANDIGEVNIVANAYSAQYGGLGGVQENVLTRSGTNKFHGNATYWWTNSDLNANDWFNDNSGAAQPFANANQWGAAVGGPIVRDKAFFFVNYEGLRFVTSPSDFVTIPSPAYQAAVLGNLTASGNAAEIPFYQKIFSLYNNAPGASTSQGYAVTADPALGGAPYANFFEGNPKNLLTEVLVTARYDQKLGPNDNMFIHFSRDHGLQPTHVDPISPAFNQQSDQPDYGGQLEETHTFSPNVINQFLLSGSWYSAYFVNPNPALEQSTFPYTLSFSLGFGEFTDLGGIDYIFPQGRNVTQYQVNDDVSWTRGKHTAGFGFIFKRNDVTDADLGILTVPLGVELGPADGGSLSAGDYFGSGLMFEGIQNFPQRLTEPIALYNLGFYAQDQWKVTPNFQFSAGVRVEHNSNPICVTTCFARFGDSYNNVTADATTAYNSVIKSNQRNAFVDLQKYAVDPRIGFTYSLPNHPNTLFRGGFGIFTDSFPATTADSLLSNPPLEPEFVQIGALADPSQPGSFTSGMAATNQSFQSAFASGGSATTISAANPNFTLPSITNADKSIHYPTYEEWSLQWEQQIGRNTSFRIGYVGNHGYHEPVVNNGVNISEASTATDSAGNPLFTGLPATPALPAFAQITEIQSVASSNYNGVVATLTHRSKWVSGSLNYAWSHALDEISNGGFLPFGALSPTHPVDPFNLALQNYGNADYDLRHNLNGNYLIRVPGANHLKLLTDGWLFGGTLFWHTGFPFSVTDSAATSNLGFSGSYGGTALASIINPAVPHHCGKNVTTPCFGTAALGTYFADPTSFGGQRRNQFYGPGFFNTDFNLMKDFKIPGMETGKLEVGAQAYNVLNHPNFANPVFDADSSAVGLVQSTVSVPTSVFGSFLGGDASPRILQLKAKFEF